MVVGEMCLHESCIICNRGSMRLLNSFIRDVITILLFKLGNALNARSLRAHRRYIVDRSFHVHRETTMGLLFEFTIIDK